MSGLSAPSNPIRSPFERALAAYRSRQPYEIATAIVPFEPDTLLPSQWYQHHSRMLADPCARLHLAVLEDAVETLRRYKGVDTANGRHQRQLVKDWLWDLDGRWHEYTITFRTAVDVVFGDAVEAEDFAKSILKAAAKFGPRAVTFQRQARTRRDRY